MSEPKIRIILRKEKGSPDLIEWEAPASSSDPPEGSEVIICPVSRGPCNLNCAAIVLVKEGDDPITEVGCCMINPKGTGHQIGFLYWDE